MDKIILISDHRDNQETRFTVPEDSNDEKANLIEYFSQTGSYYKTHDEFTWTPGIYNIINRSKEASDAYYNIIFENKNKKNMIFKYHTKSKIKTKIQIQNRKWVFVSGGEF